MAERWSSFVCTFALVLLIGACTTDAHSSSSSSSGEGSAVDRAPGSERPPFEADFGARGESEAGGPIASKEDPLFRARVKTMLRSVLGSAFANYDWDGLIDATNAWNGAKVWIPGTGCRTADEGGQRAMSAVPAGFAEGGPAITFSPGASASIGFWLGFPSSQAIGGARFRERDRLSALEVFTTAWPDAVTIAATFGATLKGVWIVGHSAGALPAVLAGLIGGAHRIDAYGVPSAVGFLDGDAGIVHLHTHPLDPAGSMGSLDASGVAKIDLAGAFVTTIKAGGTLAYHDYATWSAPSP